MSKLTQAEIEEFINNPEQDLEDDDYGFILGPDGELKSIIFPEAAPFKTPKNVAKILKLFGITDPGQFIDPTIH